jgi:predicted TIM-barrel fold metal-dependent hydrolase
MGAHGYNATTMPPRETIIDAWAQPMFRGGALPEVTRLFERSGSAHLLNTDLTAEQMVRLMDAAGVEQALLSAWCRPSGWIFTNDDVAAIVRQFPARFVGVATVELEKPLAAELGAGAETKRTEQGPEASIPAHRSSHDVPCQGRGRSERLTQRMSHPDT